MTPRKYNANAVNRNRNRNSSITTPSRSTERKYSTVVMRAKLLLLALICTWHLLSKKDTEKAQYHGDDLTSEGVPGGPRRRSRIGDPPELLIPKQLGRKRKKA